MFLLILGIRLSSLKLMRISILNTIVPVRANDSCNGHKIHVGHFPIVYIRFNPDTYIEKGVILLHLFSQNKLVYLVIKNFKQEEWKHCLSTLCDTIQYWINHDHVTDKTVEVVHLFFFDQPLMLVKTQCNLM